MYTTRDTPSEGNLGVKIVLTTRIPKILLSDTDETNVNDGAYPQDAAFQVTKVADVLSESGQALNNLGRQMDRVTVHIPYYCSKWLQCEQIPRHILHIRGCFLRTFEGKPRLDINWSEVPREASVDNEWTASVKRQTKAHKYHL